MATVLTKDLVHMSVVDDYFKGLDATSRATFEHVRALAMEVAPEAEDGTSYGVAALRYRQRPLLGFRAGKEHLSIFPFSPAVIEAVRSGLDGFELSKGTIRFTTAAPLPDEVVRDVVRLRLHEIVGRPR